MTVFVSHAIGSERLPFASAGDEAPGRLKWRELAAEYRLALEAAGEVVREIVRPEVYQTPESWRQLGAVAGDWHLAVKPLSHLRPFHGLANVVVVGDLTGTWDPAPGFPVDPGMMLLRADAVLCLSEVAEMEVKRRGHSRVVVLPPGRDGDQLSFAAGLEVLREFLR